MNSSTGDQSLKTSCWMCNHFFINQCVKPRHSWLGYKHTGEAC